MTKNTKVVRTSRTLNQLVYNEKLGHKVLSKSDPDERLITDVYRPCDRAYRFLSPEREQTENYTPVTLECECGHKLQIDFPVDLRNHENRVN